MNKEALVKAVAGKTGLAKKDVTAVVEAFTETVTEALASGDKVQIVGWGVFETRKRAARVGRNPQDGTPVQIPESVAPFFKAGKNLKDSVK